MSPGLETTDFQAESLEGFQIDGKYRIGMCLAQGDRQAIYETVRGDAPAMLRLISAETPDEAAEFLSAFRAARNLRHPHLLEVYDCGELSLRGMQRVYVVTDRPDENLATALRERALDPAETRQILDGVIPALAYLHQHGYVHGRVRPSEVLACGDIVKLSPDSIRPIAAGSDFGDPPGLYEAPETATGRWAPPADAWSVAILILETLTRSPERSGVSILPEPFREIVEGGLQPDPQTRWTVEQMSAALAGRPQSQLPAEILTPAPPPVRQAKYRRYGGLAVGGALAAAAVCTLLIRSAHQTPPQAPVTIQAPAVTPAPLAVAPEPPAAVTAAVPAGWAVVGAAYHRPADAEKRAADFRKAHPKLHPRVYTAGQRYLVIFASGFSTEKLARRELERARSSGAPRDSYLTRFR